MVLSTLRNYAKRSKSKILEIWLLCFWIFGRGKVVAKKINKYLISLMGCLREERLDISVDTWLKFVGMITGIIAGVMLNYKFPSEHFEWAFLVFLVCSTCWTTVGLRSKDWNMVTLNGFFAFLNVVGINTWLLPKFFL